MTVPQMPPGPPLSGPPGGPGPGAMNGFGTPPQGRAAGPGGMDRDRILATVVAAAGLGTFISAFFALYSVRIAPADWDGVAGIDARSEFPGVTGDDAVSVHMGFFDAVPFASPIMATVVPAAMILAAVLAGGMALRRSYTQAGPTALAAVVAAVVGLMMLIVTPLPSVSLSGAVREEFQAETGMSSLGDLLDTFVPVRPGIGLILAFCFAVVGAVAAIALYVLPPATARRLAPPQQAPGPGQMPLPGMFAGHPPAPQQAPWQAPQQPAGPPGAQAGYPPVSGPRPGDGPAAPAGQP